MKWTLVTLIAISIFATIDGADPDPGSALYLTPLIESRQIAKV